MGYRLSNRSRSNLEGVHPDLVAVVERAIEITKQDFLVVEGVRTPARQKVLFAQGRTKPGRKVTWTMNSNHFVNKTTKFGHAVDIAPFPVDWNDTRKFDAMATAMFRASRELGVLIRWGANWDQDENVRERGEHDSPHFELVGY
jgi:peptidoglycan L-alanyl-D-glutamate endopeptidase CwlK